LLVGADLRDADLRGADLLGADLRGTDLGGADLTGAFFCTPMQLAAARGDTRTRPPLDLQPPSHWADVAVPLSPPAPGGRARRVGRGPRPRGR
ncbi:pentapeptide repeat-containing protein, partial [Actinotalea ferrariae]|uniref:pentapeptide repeat-containing protein n=1 Tax=Actinotalea ferrariae TaxID=1386098 RepID=UPI001C8C9E0F